MRAFCKGFLLGTCCICVLAVIWLCRIRPGITLQEVKSLKASYTQAGPRAHRSGADPFFAVGKSDSPLDFAALQIQYPDIKAWITIPGTVVDYPVLQSSIADPEYYLRRNYKGERRTAGSLFLQADCALDGRVAVIYGHNMVDGSMFGCLPQYTHADFSSAHGQITLQTPDEIRTYQIFSVVETDIAQFQFNQTVFCDSEAFRSFVQGIKAHSLITADLPAPAEQLLILVTCSYSWEGARYVIAAQRVR